MTTYDTIKISELTQASSVDTDALKLIVQGGETKNVEQADNISSSISSDANNAISVGTDDKLFTTDATNADNISSGTLPDARLSDTAVAAGSYTSSNITVDAKGRITSASSGSISALPTYSVNSGLTSINKVSDSEVSFTGAPVVTFPNGNTYTLTTINNVTGISGDGTYDVLILEDDITGGNTVTPIAVLSSTVAETLADGTGGSSGDYNLNTQVRPLKPEYNNGGVWEDKEFLKLGGFVISGGTMATPYVYAFNRCHTVDWFAVSANTLYTKNTYMGINADMQKILLLDSQVTTTGIYCVTTEAANGGILYGAIFGANGKNSVKVKSANNNAWSINSDGIGATVNTGITTTNYKILITSTF